MKIGMIFPGQGSQVLGMIKDIYDRERIVQEYFEQASSCLDQNFVRLCFASSDRELRETINAQTSIFLVSASLTALLKEKYEIEPNIVAGHSSGEYAAIFAAGGMSFPDALYLLKKRSIFMEEATKQYAGTMIAVLGLDSVDLQEICSRYDDPSDNVKVAEIVNHNTPHQFVVSGTPQELDFVSKDVRSAGGKIIELNVAGAFHSRLMKAAEEQFSQYMVKVDFKDLNVPLVTNVDAKSVTNHEDLKSAVVRQMSSHVMWWRSMEYFSDCDIIVEVGPGSKLSKMIKRELPDQQVMSINTAYDIEQFLNFLGKEVKKSELELDLEREQEEKQIARENKNVQQESNDDSKVLNDTSSDDIDKSE